MLYINEITDFQSVKKNVVKKVIVNK